MRAYRITTRAATTLVLTAALLAAMGIGAPAHALAPLGACCMADGSCTDVTAGECGGPGQTFVGDGTSCATVDCAAPLAAPAASIFGIVAATGALVALGAGRLVSRRRRR